MNTRDLDRMQSTWEKKSQAARFPSAGHWSSPPIGPLARTQLNSPLQVVKRGRSPPSRENDAQPPCLPSTAFRARENLYRVVQGLSSNPTHPKPGLWIPGAARAAKILKTVVLRLEDRTTPRPEEALPCTKRRARVFDGAGARRASVQHRRSGDTGVRHDHAGRWAP